MGVRGTALIRSSEPYGRLVDSTDTPIDVLLDFFGSRKYRFELEVTVPGRAPYTVEGEWKVPMKAEQTGPLRTGGDTLPPGVVVPVEISARPPAKVDIDWDAYVATPGRKKTQKQLYDRRRIELTAAYAEAQARKRHSGSGERRGAPD